MNALAATLCHFPLGVLPHAPSYRNTTSGQPYSPCNWREMPLLVHSFLLLRKQSCVEMSSIPLLSPPLLLPLCITPVVSSFENSLPLPMGPTLKNKGRRDGGKRKENSIVLSKGISEKLQVSLCRFWLLCVLLSNPASLRGCHFAFISADRPVVSHCSPSPASVSAELPGFSRPP